MGNEGIWRFPKIRGTFGVPIVRIIIFWGLSWGPLFRETTISSLCNTYRLISYQPPVSPWHHWVGLLHTGFVANNAGLDLGFKVRV